jgi:hypothetical protein
LIFAQATSENPLYTDKCNKWSNLTLLGIFLYIALHERGNKK